MQTPTAIAASPTMFAAPQGAGQATGLGGMLDGLFDASADGEGAEGQFSDVLGAALAAAMGVALPAQPVQAQPAPTVEEPAKSPTLAAAPVAAAFIPAAADSEALQASPVEPAQTPLLPAALQAGLAEPVDTAPIFQQAQRQTQDPAPDLSTKAAPAVSAAATPEPTSATPVAHSVATPQPQVAAAPPQAPASTANTPPPSPVVAPVQSPVAAATVAVTAAEPAEPAAAQAEAVQTPVAKPAQAEPGARGGKAKAAAGDARHASATAAAPSAAAPGDQVVAAKAEASAGQAGHEAALPAAADDSAPAHADLEQPLTPGQAHAIGEHRPSQDAAVETPRATPQTVALLAAQIANKIDGKATRFDVQLDPHGLGKVDVQVEISARGQISAALTFENPQSAAELRGKSGELQAALEQAGFDLSKTSLSFNSGGQGQQQSLFDQQQQQNNTPVWRGRAFTDLSDTPETAPAPVQRRAATGGVDVRI